MAVKASWPAGRSSVVVAGAAVAPRDDHRVRVEHARVDDGAAEREIVAFVDRLRAQAYAGTVGLALVTVTGMEAVAD